MIEQPVCKFFGQTVRTDRLTLTARDTTPGVIEHEAIMSAAAGDQALAKAQFEQRAQVQSALLECGGNINVGR